VRTTHHPEGSIQEHINRVLTRAACGHLAYRSLNGASIPLFVVERAWAIIPCEECEPRYVIEVLDYARRLVEASWARGYYARDRYKFAVHPTDERAVAWNTVGAIWRGRHDAHNVGVQDITSDYVAWKALGVVADATCGMSCPHTSTERNILLITDWELRPRREKDDVLRALTAAKNEVLTAVAQRDEDRRNGFVEDTGGEEESPQAMVEGSPSDEKNRLFCLALDAMGVCDDDD
jgi:hypothetical protein